VEQRKCSIKPWILRVALIASICFVCITFVWISYLKPINDALSIPPSARFDPVPALFPGASITQEETAGGLSTSWENWTIVYLVGTPISDVQDYYQRELQRYCHDAYSWTGGSSNKKTSCFTKPCTPLIYPMGDAVGRGPFQYFSVELEVMPDTKTRAKVDVYRSIDFCYS
jgi:hypothetical protein